MERKRKSVKKLLALLLVTAVFALISATIVQMMVSGNDVTLTATIYGEIFTPGDTVMLTISISNNTGFMTMPLRLSIPDGLELIGLNVGHTDLINGFMSPWDDTALLFPPIEAADQPLTGNVFMGWFFRESSFVDDADLLILTFRISDDAAIGETDDITITFADTQGEIAPTDKGGIPVDIILPGDDEDGAIGSITVGCPIEIARAELRELIEYAENLRDTTMISELNGTDIRADEYWTTPEVRAEFQRAIDAAWAVYNSTAAPIEVLQFAANALEALFE